MKSGPFSGRTRTGSNWSRIAVAVAIVLAVAELADAFFIDVPAAAVVMAALFVAGVLWTRRGGIGGLVLLVFLFALEVVSIPTYKRTTIGDWILQIAVGLVAAAGLVAALAAIRGLKSRRAMVDPMGATADRRLRAP